MARGPAYPYVDLETAVSLATKTYQFTKRSFAPLDAVIKEAWGYSPTSSSGIKVFAAMKYYGLIEQHEENGTVRLTDRAYRIVVDDQSSDEWLDAVREAALSPRWYRFCWETWGADMPPSMKRSLLFEHGFVDTTVDGFLRDYKKTVAFARLAESRPASPIDEQDDESFPIKAKDNSNESVVESPKSGVVFKARPISGVNMRQEMFSLPEGTVIVEWPGYLSSESFEDLSDWLDILKRKISRAAKQGTADVRSERQESTDRMEG